MPCNDWRGDEPSPSRIDQANMKQMSQDLARMQKQIDLVEGYLCETLKSYKKNVGSMITFDRFLTQHDGLVEWWVDHLERDAKRDEEIRKNALLKLTDDEKRVLGIVHIKEKK